MKRYFLIFLLVLLPLQFSWAIAGTVCTHEEAAAPHFGHHVNKHDEAGGEAGDEAGGDARHDSRTIPSGLDGDCDYCHHVPSNAMTPAAPALAQPGQSAHLRTEPPRYRSHIPDLIPRPDWSLRS